MSVPSVSRLNPSMSSSGSVPELAAGMRMSTSPSSTQVSMSYPMRLHISSVPDTLAAT